jgi:hypothetical protein
LDAFPTDRLSLTEALGDALASAGRSATAAEAYLRAAAIPSASFSLLDDADNVVDVVIDKVLALGGNVIFVENGLLSKLQSTALILRTDRLAA